MSDWRACFKVSVTSQNGRQRLVLNKSDFAASNKSVLTSMRVSKVDRRTAANSFKKDPTLFVGYRRGMPAFVSLQSDHVAGLTLPRTNIMPSDFEDGDSDRFDLVSVLPPQAFSTRTSTASFGCLRRNLFSVE
jgi:hypothetical protein